ncbi:hypothetical protein BC831DRAFT_443497 [Entophlyctis helioformis]|nr:hypothetical protein BC831DRAFT_443497 [Entophlyctis helioformis]
MERLNHFQVAKASKAKDSNAHAHALAERARRTGLTNYHSPKASAAALGTTSSTASSPRSSNGKTVVEKQPPLRNLKYPFPHTPPAHANKWLGRGSGGGSHNGKPMAILAYSAGQPPTPDPFSAGMLSPSATPCSSAKIGAVHIQQQQHQQHDLLLQHQIDSLKDTVSTIQNSHDLELAAHTLSIDGLSVRTQATASSLLELQTLTQSAMDQHKDTVEKLQDRVSRLGESATASVSRVESDLTARLESTQASVEKLAAAVADSTVLMDVDAKRGKRKLDDLQTATDAVNERLSSTEAHMLRLTARLDELEILHRKQAAVAASDQEAEVKRVKTDKSRVAGLSIRGTIASAAVGAVAAITAAAGILMAGSDYLDSTE